MAEERRSPSDTNNNPCISCGACCAHFRVSFYWAEAAELGIPDALTERVSPLYSCMAGTHSKTPRCAALQGDIGTAVACSVYAQRPSPCREVLAGDAKCLAARRRHGLG